MMKKSILFALALTACNAQPQQSALCVDGHPRHRAANISYGGPRCASEAPMQPPMFNIRNGRKPGSKIIANGWRAEHIAAAILP